jgi:hypothetical protein
MLDWARDSEYVAGISTMYEPRDEPRAIFRNLAPYIARELVC